LAAGQTDTITFAFSGAVTGFDLADVSATGGTLSNLQQVTGDPTHYTATFTPTANFQGTGSVQVLASGSGAASWTDVAGNAGTASGVFSIAENTQTGTTIDSGASAEISGASAAAITFANNSGVSGTLMLDNSVSFTGQITGLAGDGTSAHSDAIDLKDINFATATESYASGTLTVSDGTHTANIHLNGTYVLANFTLSNDGSGGTLVIDPPVTSSTSGSMDVLSQVSASGQLTTANEGAIASSSDHGDSLNNDNGWAHNLAFQNNNVDQFDFKPLLGVQSSNSPSLRPATLSEADTSGVTIVHDNFVFQPAPNLEGSPSAPSTYGHQSNTESGHALTPAAAWMADFLEVMNHHDPLSINESPAVVSNTEHQIVHLQNHFIHAA
jgi:hypothetical protein